MASWAYPSELTPEAYSERMNLAENMNSSLKLTGGLCAQVMKSNPNGSENPNIGGAMNTSEPDICQLLSLNGHINNGLYNNTGLTLLTNGHHNHLNGGGGINHQGLVNSLPNDLDFDSLQGGLECDVDQVIRHELNVEGNLDFNFSDNSATSSMNAVTMSSMGHGHGHGGMNGHHHGVSGQPVSMSAVSTSISSTPSHSWVH